MLLYALVSGGGGGLGWWSGFYIVGSIRGRKKQFFINILSKMIRLKYKEANAKNIAKESCRLAVTRLAVSDPVLTVVKHN